MFYIMIPGSPRRRLEPQLDVVSLLLQKSLVDPQLQLVDNSPPNQEPILGSLLPVDQPKLARLV